MIGRGGRGMLWIDIDFSKATRQGNHTRVYTSIMSMRCSDNRPAVTDCPSTRQLMPRHQSTLNHEIYKDRDTPLYVKRNEFLRYEQQRDSLYLDNSPSSLCGRRAMVNKIWCRKIAKAWLEAKPEAPHPRTFSEPKCQDYVCAWYLVYRCTIILAWLTIIVCSIFEFGSEEPLGNNHKWPIYLTNWDLVLGGLQASLGLWLVTKRWKLQTSLDFDAANLSLGKIEKFYWFLYTSTCTIALGVTVSYWCAVHDPKIHHVDALNIMIHIFNSLLMIVDMCVMNIPLRLRHFWWSLTIVVSYLIFTVIYYSAGGHDKRGYVYIYKVLNWQKPGISLLVCTGGLIFLIIVHCLLCLSTTIRERKCSRNSEKYACETIVNSTNKRSTIKRVEII